jgi:heme exporter protein D
LAFDSFSDFLSMGGYGFFVWLSFGVSLVAMLALVVESRWAYRQLFIKMGQEQARKKRIEAARATISKEP